MKTPPPSPRAFSDEELPPAPKKPKRIAYASGRNIQAVRRQLDFGTEAKPIPLRRVLVSYKISAHTTT